jgi:hypothetical protein
MNICQKLIVTSLLITSPLASRAQSTNSPTTAENVKQAGKNAAVTAGHYTEEQVKELDKAAEKQFHELRKN